MRGGALASPAEITALAGTLRDMGNLEEGLALAKDGVSRFADNIGLSGAWPAIFCAAWTGRRRKGP